ncbi:MAG: hypothetical protein AAB445_03305 [Patescibacteria group bacterium]
MSENSTPSTPDEQSRSRVEQQLELIIALIRKVTAETPKGKILRVTAGEEVTTVQVLSNDQDCLVLITGVEKTPPKNGG